MSENTLILGDFIIYILLAVGGCAISNNLEKRISKIIIAYVIPTLIFLWVRLSQGLLF